MPAGRPSDYTDELAEEICRRIADGESLRSVCSTEGMPGKATVMRWLGANEIFRDHYAKAREVQADAIFDEILDIADDGSNDWMERLNSDGENIGWQFNGEAARRSQLRVDARKWVLGRMLPKKYGERHAVEVSGPDGGPVEITDRERAKALLAVLSRADVEKSST